MMLKRLGALAALFGALVLALPAAAQEAAQEVAPGILYAIGEKFDGSFNEGAYAAMERFEADTGIPYVEFEPENLTQFDQGIDAMARRGANAIIVIGFYYAQPLAAAAARYPEIRFTIIDAVTEAPNVRSVLFREHEGSFLTGIMAAMASKTGHIGFVGAIDIPLIRKFVTGFEEGTRHVNPEITYTVNFVGTDPSAFNDPTTAGELARSQIARGADVIFAGSGNSNLGIFQAAKDLGVLAIGVDSNQNGAQPGTILTSMLKRVDVAVYGALDQARSGEWQPGIVSLGLAEDGVGYAVDENNRPLLTDDMLAAVEEARQAIIAGDIVVTDASAQ